MFTWKKWKLSCLHEFDFGFRSATARPKTWFRFEKRHNASLDFSNNFSMFGRFLDASILGAILVPVSCKHCLHFPPVVLLLIASNLDFSNHKSPPYYPIGHLCFKSILCWTLVHQPSASWPSRSCRKFTEPKGSIFKETQYNIATLLCFAMIRFHYKSRLEAHHIAKPSKM